MNVKMMIAPFALLATFLSGCTVHAYNPSPTTAAQAQVLEQPANTAATPAKARPAVSPRKAVLLGVRKVAFGVDKDTIRVKHKGRFRAIKLHVSGSPMALYDIKVSFADGTKFSPKTRLHFHQGSWTRTIDLPRNKRRITKVEFLYRSKGAKSGRAKVQLFGIR